MLAPGAAGLYFVIDALFFTSRLRFTGPEAFVSYLLYFVYMALVGLLVGLANAGFGYQVTLRFVKAIYRH